MPRTPRNSPNPPGRPPKVGEVGAAVDRAKRTGESLASAAKAAGVSPSTVRAHKAKRVGKGGSSPAGSSPSKPPSVATGSQALPQGGAVSGRPELLDLVRRILTDRGYGAALSELEEGLRVQAAEGEPGLAPWLARPARIAALAGDELEALSGVLGELRGLLANASPAAGERLAIVKALDSVSKSLSVIRTRRPEEPKPDEVQEKIRGKMETCVEHLLRHTREDAAAEQRERDAFAAAVLAGHLAPVEVVARVDKLLGFAA